jgi:DivIVA domain-containing protein
VTNDNHRPEFPRYQSPQSIRDETFRRRMRGLDQDEVYEYLDLLADQVHATERALRESRAENERLQAEVQRVQADLDEYEQVGERVNDQVVQLFSQAQLVAEEMVQDASRDARERIGQVRAHERKIVEEAMDVAGEQVRSYARTAQAQMQSIMDSFTSEVDRLGSTPLSGESGSASTHQNDPLFDDLGAGETRALNGSRPESPGSE